MLRYVFIKLSGAKKFHRSMQRNANTSILYLFYNNRRLSREEKARINKELDKKYPDMIRYGQRYFLMKLLHYLAFFLVICMYTQNLFCRGVAIVPLIFSFLHFSFAISSSVKRPLNDNYPQISLPRIEYPQFLLDRLGESERRRLGVSESRPQEVF